VDGYFDKLDPSLFGISCIPPADCVAVGDQADGSERTTLGQTDAGTPSAAAAEAS
jgi:hypothetical protein